MTSIIEQRQAAIKEVMNSTSQQLKEIIGKPVTLVYKIKVNDISESHIIQTVCKVCGTTWSKMMSKSKTNDVLVPRQITAWLLARYCGYSLTKIQNEFGKSDHTTILHMVHRVNDMIETNDPLYMIPLRAIENSILKLTEEAA